MWSEPLTNLSSPARVLVVEDDTIVGGAVAAILRHFGHSVTLAADGAHALRELGEGTWDVLLTDHQMPDTLGTTLAREARRVSPNLWIILCSGRVRFSAEELHAHGVDRMLPKPITGEQLAQALDDRPRD